MTNPYQKPPTPISAELFKAKDTPKLTNDEAVQYLVAFLIDRMRYGESEKVVKRAFWAAVKERVYCNAIHRAIRIVPYTEDWVQGVYDAHLKREAEEEAAKNDKHDEAAGNPVMTTARLAG